MAVTGMNRVQSRMGSLAGMLKGLEEVTAIDLIEKSWWMRMGKQESIAVGIRGFRIIERYGG